MSSTNTTASSITTSTSTSTSSTTLMPFLSVSKAQTAYPTGDKNFAVKQAFPASIKTSLSDPFLMLDHFGPAPSRGLARHEDEYPVNWHPHRGMDICTYFLSGTGRHADSLGNRGTYRSPGMQWISVGSGIEHAEGGGTPAGQMEEGFQIWINVPAKLKMATPQYGVTEPEDMPVITDAVTGQAVARLIAGKVGEQIGPFKTAVNIEIIDLFVGASANGFVHRVNDELNNCIVYVYRGEGKINGQQVSKGDVVHLDASRAADRGVHFASASSTSSSSSSPLHCLLFAGRRLAEPVAWRGPIVMNTNQEISATFEEIYGGEFPPVRAAWNYKKWASFPEKEKQKILAEDEKTRSITEQQQQQRQKGDEL